MTRAITVEVWEFDFDAYELSYLGELTSDSKRQWLDDLRDTGSFSLEIKVGSADEDLCQPGRFLRFLLYGVPKWWGVIEPPLSKVSADPRNRKSGLVISVKGRGALSLLEFAPLYPELGLGRISPDTRYFNFASLDYDASGWTTATELKQQNDPDDTKPWFGAPKSWPDPTAWWIGPAGADTPPVAPGDVYFRGTFTVASGQGGEYRFFLTADDGFELYIDGDKATAEQGVGLWGATRYYDKLMDEGSHLIAVKAINFDRPVSATNVFGFIMSVYKLEAGGQFLGTLVSSTTSGTQMLAFPSTAPGMTPGHILKIQFEEMFGVYFYLDPINYDFDEDVDSNGVSWSDEIDLSFSVGTSTLEIGRKLIAEKACDLWVDPADTAQFLMVRAFIDKGEDLTGAVTVAYADNLSELEHDKTFPLINTVLSRTAEGRWIETADPTAIASWGKRGVVMSQGSAPSNDAATRQATSFLDDNAEPKEVITKLRVEPVPGGPVPNVDFFTGDRITGPGYDGTPKAFKVIGIHTSDSSVKGKPTYELDLEEYVAA